MSVKVEADINIGREGSKQIGKKNIQKEDTKKVLSHGVNCGCTRVHVDNAENENGLEHGKIRIMIELLYNLHRIDKTFNG